MVSRENRVILSALVLALALSVGLVALDVQLHAIGLFAIYAVAILLPQFYLATTATDDDVAPQTRIRVGVAVTALLGLLLWNDATGFERQLLGGLVIALVGALLVSELVATTRTSGEEPQGE